MTLLFKIFGTIIVIPFGLIIGLGLGVLFMPFYILFACVNSIWEKGAEND